MMPHKLKKYSTEEGVYNVMPHKLKQRKVYIMCMPHKLKKYPTEEGVHNVHAWIFSQTKEILNASVLDEMTMYFSYFIDVGRKRATQSLPQRRSKQLLCRLSYFPHRNFLLPL